jgi:hypothetical protein
MEIKLNVNIAGNDFTISADDRGDNLNDIFIQLSPFLNHNISKKCDLCDSTNLALEVNKATNGGFIYTKLRCKVCLGFRKLNQAKETKVFFWDPFKPRSEEFSKKD